MSVLLSHNSALEVLRAVPPQAGMLKALEEPFDMKAAASGVRCVRDALSSCGALRQRPAPNPVRKHPRRLSATGTRRSALLWSRAGLPPDGKRDVPCGRCRSGV